MNKMFIIGSSKDLYNEAVSLVDGYILNSVGDESLNKMDYELNEIKKKINKTLISIVALSVIFKTVSSTIRKNKMLDKAKQQKKEISPTVKRNIISKSKQVEDQSYVEEYLQQLNVLSSKLKQTKADIEDQQANIKKEYKDRKDLIKKAGAVDDPEIKKMLKTKDKEISKIVKNAQQELKEVESLYNYKASKARTLVAAYGNEGQLSKLDIILSKSKSE